jgi:aminoglycoside phosphotransferase
MTGVLVCPPPAAARDPAFLRALDPAFVAGQVQRRLVTDGELVTVRPDYVRWKDHDGSLLGYRAVVVSAGRRTDTYVSVRTAAPDRLADEAARLGHRRDEQHAGLRSFALVADAGMLLLALPIDRAIGDLRRFVQPGKVKTLVANACPELVPSGLRLSKSRSRSELVRYKPERRAVLRWDLALVDGRGHGATTPAVWLRCLAAPQGARSALATRAAAAAGVRCPVALAVPHERLVVESHVVGRRWSPDDACTAANAAAASALATLHAQADPAGMPSHGPLEQLDLALRAVEDLARLSPELGRQGAALADLLARRVPPLCRLGFAHGDMHRGQVLLGDDGRAGLVDFDRACAAPAALDLASAFAHDVVADPQHGGVAAQRFQAAYARCRPLPAAAELAWWQAAALLRAATAPFRALRPDWRSAAATLLEQAAQAVAVAR